MLEDELSITEPVKQAYFVDFLRDAPEPTGDEADDADLDAPKIYEQVTNRKAFHTELIQYTCTYGQLLICVGPFTRVSC